MNPGQKKANVQGKKYVELVSSDLFHSLLVVIFLNEKWDSNCLQKNDQTWKEGVRGRFAKRPHFSSFQQIMSILMF